MDSIQNGWFSELSTLWPGQAMSLEVEEVLHQERSKYQDILVFKSKTYGNVLVLDGIIQCTERDEFSYQEMITHIPLNSHPEPSKVLIVGGGDGGVAREILKHDEVQSVTMCEIDEKVIEMSKKYLPGMSCAFSNPKLTLHIGDGFEFMKKNTGEFDVIITDSSDPIGPASSLFEKSYYKLMKKALRPEGIVCAQGECLWLHMDLIRNMQEFCKTLYASVSYAYCTIPTYPSGQIGFLLCSLSQDTNFKEPVRKYSTDDIRKLKLRYYNEDVHRASFVLPQFAVEALERSTSKSASDKQQSS